MSRREIKVIYGVVVVEDSHGIRLSIKDGDRNSASVPLTAENAEEIGRILSAFAVVNKRSN